MATWVRVASSIAMLLLCSCGLFFIANGTVLWQRLSGFALTAFGVAGFIDVLVSRIILEHDVIRVVSLVRRRTYSRGEFESAKVDGGAIALKKKAGGWLVLPDTGANALAVRNTIHAWINRRY